MPKEPKYITLVDSAEPARPRHLAYYEYGDHENSEILVCVHGLTRNGLDFELLAESLANKYRIICPDIAGRGNSNWFTNKADYNYVTYVTDVNFLLTYLSLKNVTWIGTSMGGIIGMILAAGNPGLVKKMILNDIGEVVSGEGLKRIIAYVGSTAEFAGEAEAFAYLRSVMTPWGITSEEEWNFLFKISFTKLPDGKYALRYDPGIGIPLRQAAAKQLVTDVDLTQFWNKITCPTLILRGSESDILTHETALHMCNRANVKLIELDGIGHAPSLLAKNQIQLITDWLDISR